MDAFPCVPLPPRPSKPRDVGLTMALDKGMGAAALEDWLGVAAAHVDVVKFGWGTGRVTPRDVLVRKTETLRAAGVLACPGGTFLELAYAHGAVGEFLAEARDLGFDCVEVSDGTVTMSEADKVGLIRRARDAGFHVFSEVGKKMKFEDGHLSLAAKISAARQELEAGASKVILEGRESGLVGIFDDSGKVIETQVDEFLQSLGMANVIFEAPQHSQQVWLIANLGNRVNLGNVAPEAVVGLETLRLGLRSETLREHHLGACTVRIECGIIGAVAAAQRGDVAVVIDVLRASSTIVAALGEGVRSVKPVASPEECVGELTAGERGGKKIPGLDLDNSPLAFRRRNLGGKALVLTTTNGTECIKAATSGAAAIFIGCLLNARSVAERALSRARQLGRNITLVVAGRNNAMAVEDLLGASEILSNMQDVTVRGQIQPINSKDLTEDLLNSESGRNLTALGAKEDVLFCAGVDVYSVVPELVDGLLVDTSTGA